MLTRYCCFGSPCITVWACQVSFWVRFLIWNACICFQVQSYDPDTNTWLLRATIPIAKRCITAVSLNNLIYVAGGLTKAIYCYDPIEDYWMHVQNTFSRQVINTKRPADIWKVLFLHKYLGMKWVYLFNPVKMASDSILTILHLCNWSPCRGGSF